MYIGIILISIIILILWAIAIYNRLIKLRNLKEEGWSGVDVQLKRRHDLVGNLVNSVKGYMAHERGVLDEVTRHRADSQKAKNVGESMSAEAGLSGALGRLFAVMENYPDLKANENFRDLQVQLEGTENRISTERRKFNDDARVYNQYIMQFPRNIFASIFGFKDMAYFTAEPDSEVAPQVQF